MKRQIIRIDGEKCNGCGACVGACHEGAITLVDGKARLLRDDYCDGLGNCLPACPTGAITFEERDAAPYDEIAAQAAIRAAKKPAFSPVAKQERIPALGQPALACGCPGSAAKSFARHAEERVEAEPSSSELAQWPVQIKLVPVNAPYFAGADLLVSADCAAYAFAGFHREFMRGKVTLIGCPKLDEGDYTEKLAAIISQNDIKSLTVVRMEVPCCGGLAKAATEALKASGKFIPWQVVTISTDGKKR
jgi:NAD-dependent dihydropyrimidine dehydrogenase PreA subunit